MILVAFQLTYLEKEWDEFTLDRIDDGRIHFAFHSFWKTKYQFLLMAEATKRNLENQTVNLNII